MFRTPYVNKVYEYNQPKNKKIINTHDPYKNSTITTLK